MSELRLQGHLPANRFRVYAPMMSGFNPQFAESLESVSSHSLSKVVTAPKLGLFLDFVIACVVEESQTEEYFLREGIVTLGAGRAYNPYILIVAHSEGDEI